MQKNRITHHTDIFFMSFTSHSCSHARRSPRMWFTCEHIAQVERRACAQERVGVDITSISCKEGDTDHLYTYPGVFLYEIAQREESSHFRKISAHSLT